MGASPSRPLSLDSDNWRALTRAAQRERPALAWQRLGWKPPGRGTRTSAPPLGHSSLQVDLSAARSRRHYACPRPPRQPHRVQWFRPPRAVGPRPGTRGDQGLQLFTLGYYTSNGKVGPEHQNQPVRHETTDTDSATQVRCRLCTTYDIVCNIGIIRCSTSDVRHPAYVGTNPDGCRQVFPNFSSFFFFIFF